MLLAKDTTVQLNQVYANIVGHMCYAAYKLWNVCNYERIHYKELGMEQYPDWYYQKASHKEDLWYRSLPSQTAQEVCKLLDKAWKSFYVLQKSKGVQNPRPPYFKQRKMAVTYMQNGIAHEKGSEKVRLSLSKQLKGYMKSEYDIHENYLYLENKIFRDMDHIKQIRLYPPGKDGTSRVIIIFEIPEVERLEDNGRYLSIDVGLHNLMTCYDNRGKCFIVGRKYLQITQRYDKEIARVQSQWGRVQASSGVRYPKPSRHILRLYEKKKNSVKDYLHKMTNYIAGYCEKNGIHSVVIGDIKGIRKVSNLGKKTNQKLHGLPYEKIYHMLEYKLHMRGISLIRQEEGYSSQCPPTCEKVAKEYAQEKNRRYRGLYMKEKQIYNADAVGAYNILRKYGDISCKRIIMPVSGLNQVEVIKVAV